MPGFPKGEDVMDRFQIWVMIFGLGIVTLVSRSLFLIIGTRLTISDTIQRGLRFAPLGALVAILVPEMVVVKTSAGTVHTLSFMHPQFFGGITALISFMFTRNMIATIGAGMAVFTVIRIWG